ncbi:hypothetical protein BaRGS_00031626, partial [Batillaria attramentaria]
LVIRRGWSPGDRFQQSHTGGDPYRCTFPQNVSHPWDMTMKNALRPRTTNEDITAKGMGIKKWVLGQSIHLTWETYSMFKMSLRSWQQLLGPVGLPPLFVLILVQ